jgi:dethiobiotin synthetase
MRPSVSRLFVTATDTGAGKTLVTCGLAVLLRRRGRAVRAVKPVSTGGVFPPPLGEDTLQLSAATGQAIDETTGWAFREPAAPPVAARAEGRSLDLAAVVAWVRDREQGGVLLVEGVGGLLCPLTDDAVIADLVAALGYPLLIVARRGLGTLNHTLLTVEAARRRGLDVVGVLLSETRPAGSLAEATAPDELRRRLDVPVLGVLPYREPIELGRVADDLAASGLGGLFG